MNEIVEYFKHYVNTDDGQLRIFRSSRSRSRNTSGESETNQTTNTNENLKTIPRHGKNYLQNNNTDLGTTGLGNTLGVNKNSELCVPPKDKSPLGHKKSDSSNNRESEFKSHNNVIGTHSVDELMATKENGQIKDDDIVDIKMKSSYSNSSDNKVKNEEKHVFGENIKLNKGNTKSKSRNVLDSLDVDYLKQMIPYMHPSTKKHTFQFFEDRVHDVVDNKGLRENDILDVMQFRMGGTYLSEIKQLREQKWNLDYVENYFLQKDFELEIEMKKKSQLIEKSKIVIYISILQNN